MLPRAIRTEATGGLTDITRLAGLLQRAKGHTRVRRLYRVCSELNRPCPFSTEPIVSSTAFPSFHFTGRERVLFDKAKTKKARCSERNYLKSMGL